MQAKCCCCYCRWRHGQQEVQSLPVAGCKQAGYHVVHDSDARQVQAQAVSVLADPLRVPPHMKPLERAETSLLQQDTVPCI